MRAPRVAAVLLAASLALPLAGCFGLPGADDVADQAEGLAAQAEGLADRAAELADALSSVDYDKVSRLTVTDAATGEVVREVTDQREIKDAVSPLSGTNGFASAPDAPAEYVFEFWQPETQKAGQDEKDLEEVKVLEITTDQDSPVVTLEVSPIGLVLDLETSDGAADALRALAR